LHGYLVNIVTQLPALTGSEDVTIFHLHGYLPSASGPGHDSDKITLTKQSVLEMQGDPNHPWRVILRHVVRSKVLLLLGISEYTAIGNALGSILTYEAKHISADRPSGFWVAAEVEPAKFADFRTVLLDANVVPITLEKYEEIEEFLLSVCREAATRMPHGTV
jgi:hypothetical protein